jgi:hypothetical protein
MSLVLLACIQRNNGAHSARGPELANVGDVGADQGPVADELEG